MRPDFDELVGTDLSPGERERLERVHELLVAAGPPPPEVVPVAPVELQPHRRRGALLALAAALAVAAFALGAALVDGASGRERRLHRDDDRNAERGERDGVARRVRHRRGGELADGADGRGAPAGAERPPVRALADARTAELGALCGGFLTDADGSAVVPMNAPYRFDEFDGWVIVEEGSQKPLLTT